MTKRLIKLSNWLDCNGFKKEADRVDLLIFASKDRMSSFKKYINHTALNAGQAARVIIGPYDKSLRERLMELFNNFYYAAIPPWTHHTEEEMEAARMMGLTAWEWFLCGYMASDEEYEEKCLEKEANRINKFIKNADWRDYIREPREKRECLTPDAQFHTHIGDNEASVSVDLPMKLPELSDDELQEIDDAMHDAMEAIFAKYFEDEVPLFVYGTLRKGEKNHEKLKGAKFLGESTLKGFRRTKGEGPAIVPGGKNDSVEGELYQVDLEVLEKIDEYEGAEYPRELVKLEGGEDAYVYVYRPKT
jgi:gamma-glutamylcyclotransferase (GGCT)/AIG2-like uncharacterized protein YtfP